MVLSTKTTGRPEATIFVSEPVPSPCGATRSPSIRCDTIPCRYVSCCCTDSSALASSVTYPFWSATISAARAISAKKGLRMSDTSTPIVLLCAERSERACALT